MEGLHPKRPERSSATLRVGTPANWWLTCSQGHVLTTLPEAAQAHHPMGVLILYIYIYIRMRGFPERRMQVPVCGTGGGWTAAQGLLLSLLFLFLFLFLLFRCPDHLVMPTKGFPFEWTPTTTRPRPAQPLGSHVFVKDLHFS